MKKKFRMSPTLVCLLLFYLTSITHLQACTGIKLAAKDGSIIHGRTLEFGVDIDLSIVFVPRDYPFVSKTSKGPGLTYQSKYASLGAIAFNELAILDGINEKGLAVGTFYFPGFARYTSTTSENQSKSLSPIDFPNWILTQFASIDEVKRALSDVFIAPIFIKEWGTEPPFHYIVYEKSGKSLVIEPLDGKLVFYDNPLGILTNSPAFDWHMTNLRNFINLTPFNVKPLHVEGIELAPFGQGSGMVGMPGDFTPPSRFVKAAIFSITAIPSSDAEASIWQTFHILNQFDIPVGVVRAKENGVVHTDYTLMTCVRDPQALQIYFKTYANQTIKMVNLKTFDFNSKTIKRLAISSGQTVIDLSSELK